jgi:hypothetical protein
MSDVCPTCGQYMPPEPELTPEEQKRRDRLPCLEFMFTTGYGCNRERGHEGLHCCHVRACGQEWWYLWATGNGRNATVAYECPDEDPYKHLRGVPCASEAEAEFADEKAKP